MSLTVTDYPNPRILVLGHGQHGKDTAAELLAEAFNLNFISSSLFAMDHAVWPILSLTNGDNDKEECYADRSSFREVWRRLIKMYNEPTLDRLAKGILASNDMYVGMRDYQEFHAAQHMFDLILWIDTSGRKPYELSGRLFRPYR